MQSLNFDGLVIRVISLRTSHDRRQHMARVLKDVSSPWSWFDAVEGAKALDLFVDQAESQRVNQRFLLPQEIGVLASHRAVWKEFLNSNKAFLVVFEDDVVLAPEFESVLTNILSLSPVPGYVKLCAYFDRPYRAIVKFMGQYDLVRYLEEPLGLQGYLVTRKGAQRLLDVSNRPVRPIDHITDRFWETRLPCYGVYPPPVREDKAMQSTISNINERAVSGIRTQSYRQAKRIDKIFRRAANFLFGVTEMFGCTPKLK